MPKYKKSSLLSQKQREQAIVDSTNKANLLLTITILHDCYGFGKKRLYAFMDRYKELVDSCNYGSDQWEEINQEIWERFGIKII